MTPRDNQKINVVTGTLEKYDKEVQEIVRRVLAREKDLINRKQGSTKEDVLMIIREVVK